MQPSEYDPDEMDYQSFATWPMMYPGEWEIRDVTLCRNCFELASSAYPNINSPEDMPNEDTEEYEDEDFEGFDFQESDAADFRLFYGDCDPDEDGESVRTPLVERPQVISDILDSVLANIENLISAEPPSMDPVS